MNLQVAGIDAADRRLAELERAAKDPTPVLKLMADDYARAEVDLFGRLRWSLTPDYLARKAARYPGRPTGVRTGKLRASLTSRPMAVEVLSPAEMKLGTNVPYARRATLVKPETMRDAWQGRLAKHIAGAAR